MSSLLAKKSLRRGAATRRARRTGALVGATLLLASAAARAVEPPASEACLGAMAQVQAASATLPQGLLRAIGLTESARRPPDGGGVVPWPWTVNSPAGAFYLESHAAAVAKVEELQQRGLRNIDVGCMQINLRHHPHAFASLEEAFDPGANVAYAAAFLRDLRAETPVLFEAVGHYHSRTAWRAEAYARRVFRHWQRPVPGHRPDAVAVRLEEMDPALLSTRAVGDIRPSAPPRAHGRRAHRSGFDSWLAGRPAR